MSTPVILNKTAANNSQSDRRIEFLQSAAHSLAATSPTIARHLLFNSFLQLKNENLNQNSTNQIEIFRSINSYSCQKCSTILIPNITTTITKQYVKNNITNSNNVNKKNGNHSEDNKNNNTKQSEQSASPSSVRVSNLIQVCHCCGFSNFVSGSRQRRGRGLNDPRKFCTSIKSVTKIKNKSTNITESDKIDKNTASFNEKAQQRMKNQTIKKLQQSQSKSLLTNNSTTQSSAATSALSIKSALNNNVSPNENSSSNPFAGSLFFKFQQKQKTELNKAINKAEQSGSTVSNQPFNFSHIGEKRSSSPPNSSLTLLEQAAKKQKLEKKKTQLSTTKTLNTVQPAPPVISQTAIAGGSLYNLMQGFARK